MPVQDVRIQTYVSRASLLREMPPLMTGATDLLCGSRPWSIQADRRTGLAVTTATASKDNACTWCWYNCRGEVESLYSAAGLWKSLPTLLKDQGRPTKRQP